MNSPIQKNPEKNKEPHTFVQGSPFWEKREDL